MTNAVTETSEATVDTVLCLARKLPDIWNRIHEVDKERLVNLKGKVRCDTQDRILSSRCDTLHCEKEAVHDLISSLPAQSLSGAAVQLVLCLEQVDFMTGNPAEWFEDADRDKLVRLLHSALAVVVREAGLDVVATMGIRNGQPNYVSPAQSPFHPGGNTL